MKPTDGDWFTGRELENAGGGANICARIDGEDVRIGHTTRVVHGGEVIVPEAEAIANAHAMAASKAMLEALRRFTELYAFEYLGSDPRAAHANKLALAAIAKAEGR